MASVSGRVAAVKVDVSGTKSAITQISEFNLDINTDTEEQVFFGAGGWKRKIYMFSDWSGSLSGKWDTPNVTSGKEGQNKLQAWILDPSATGADKGVRMEFYIDDGTSKKVYYGYAMVKGQSMKTSATSSADVSFNFEGNGRIAYSASAPDAAAWTVLDNELA
jgi:hypothetical protein